MLTDSDKEKLKDWFFTAISVLVFPCSIIACVYLLPFLVIVTFVFCFYRILQSIGAK